jgi:VanZ family protein
LLWSDMVAFLRYWLPLLIWMGVIFSASADTQSTQRTSRLIEPLLRWLWPDITPESIEGVRWAVRKAAHLTVYAILAWLCWRALRRPVRRDTRPWSWGVAGLALLAVVIYAASDEWHQSFVANRTGAIRDVLIDTLGGVMGLGILWLLHRLKPIS